MSTENNNLYKTQVIQLNNEPVPDAAQVIEAVYKALTEKGYNPVNQIVGYIMSGDPTYITSYKGARSMIIQVERDELVEEMLEKYVENEAWKK